MDKILVVDDEKEIADLIEIYLTKEDFEVIKLYHGEDVLQIIKENEISLIMLDIMMPDIDGMTLCKQIREQYNIPIIMVSARTMDMDKIMGLSLGADDYITKPFNPVELVARVKAQIRRFTKLNPNNYLQSEIIDINGLLIDKSSFKVNLYDKEIILTPIEFEILSFLATNRGKVYSGEQIFETIWKEKYFEASNNTVMVHIRHIREKLEDNTKQPKFIKTVWGVGYKIEK